MFKTTTHKLLTVAHIVSAMSFAAYAEAQPRPSDEAEPSGATAPAQPAAKKKVRGVLFAEYFVDSREGARSLTMEGFSNGLLGPIGLDMFGFVDFNRAEAYYAEGRIVRPIWQNIGPAVEANDGTGPGNETLRWGLVGKRAFDLYEDGRFLLIGKFYPYNTNTGFENKKSVQAAFSYKYQGLSWLFINGFYDYNFIQDADNVTVTENSIDIDVGKLVGWDALIGFKPAVEFRYNGFLPGQKAGVAGGLRLDLMAATVD